MVKNIIEIVGEEGKFIVSGNHKRHKPYQVSSEKDISLHLTDIAKYFFPEPFNFDYTQARIGAGTLAWFEAFREAYNLGASKYLKLEESRQRQLEEVIKSLKDFVKPQAD